MALAVFVAFTCSTVEVEGDCPVPVPGTRQGNALAEGRAQAGFEVLYPCSLPNSQDLTSVAVVGQRGRQSATLIFAGTFELSIRQSQVAPVVNQDPSGASHIVIDNLFPGTRAELIELYDGSRRASYYLFWTRGGMHYEVRADGPPQQRRLILDIARSLR